jgi:hypothetical protein
LRRSSDIGSANISTPVIIIGFVGRSIRSQAVSTRDIASRLRGFDVGIRTSSGWRIQRVNHAASKSVNVGLAQALRESPS